MRLSLVLCLNGVAAVGSIIGPSAANAQELVTFADPEVIVNVAKGYGAANLDKDSDGNPMVAGRMDGVKYSIFFYGCQEGKNCRSMQFSTGYTDPFTVEKANEWNYKFRWIKAYASDGSTFRMDVDFKGGITPANLDVQFETWSSFIPEIRDFVVKK